MGLFVSCVEEASACQEKWRREGRVESDVTDLRKLQTWFPSSQIRSSQPCSLKVRREA